MTGRKLINHYEIIDELGRGMHGKVKLARNLETGDNVAIKIIPRFSKKRRLGKVTAMSTQDKSKKEIAILKKIRHPNVVALLEIIDDPELKKIYMVLEHVELGEVVWRKKGLPHICAYERRRVEREMRGEKPTPEEERYDRILERRQAVKDAKRARVSQHQGPSADYWSLEYGASPTDDDEIESHPHSFGRDEAEFYGRSIPSFPGSFGGSRITSRAPSRTTSFKSISRAGTPHPSEPEPPFPHEEDLETPGPLRSNPASSTGLDGTMYGPYSEEAGQAAFRGRSPSMADSIISHMSSLDYNRVHDPYVDDFSYVPCFTIDQARQTFRDTVLGLEYLHYEGVIHRDIKPANLLWTKDYRVKISDFGVSYFGRPVRDGEPDETISESEARDFDNDLELAKTVGTPAFFAPELCYTDAYDDRPGQQPKITEQIDVWSLGVTLYCLIFARIPFLAEDEWQMFRKIATEEVYIPRKRLRPVDPATKPDEKSLYTRVNSAPYRDDDELAYEEIDWDLYDLLTKMLTKNPEKRIRLRDVKRHAWVTKGLSNVIAWLDDTDPSRRTSGRKIQVDEREVARAVVPLTFLERARSAVKKAVGKVMHPRGERAESVSSRRRATSSAASSAGESPVNGMMTPHPRDSRRRSIRPDDYFAGLSQLSTEHPLTQSMTTSPISEATPASSIQQQLTSSASGQSLQQMPEFGTLSLRDDFADRQHGSPSKSLSRHVHARSVTNAFLSLTPPPSEAQTVPATPLLDPSREDVYNTLRKARDMRPAADEPGRARSVDRGLFASSDKRAEPRVALSTAVAPGNVHFSHRPRPTRSADLSRVSEKLASAASSPLTGYQHGQPKSDPNIHDSHFVPFELDERPMTAQRTEDATETLAPRVYDSATLDSFARAQAKLAIRRSEEVEAARQTRHAAHEEVEPALVPCPPSHPSSPGEEMFSSRPPTQSREDTIATTLSSSLTSMGALTTPLTSPSETTSPTTYVINPNLTKDAVEQILAFQSDPSLPALLSSTSSVSADLEGEFLGNPGVVARTMVIDTTDSLTPPAFAKEPIAGFPIETREQQVAQGLISIPPSENQATHSQFRSSHTVASHSHHHHHHHHHNHNHHLHPHSHHHSHGDEEEDSDSDEGLTMMAKRKKGTSGGAPATMGRLVHGSRRRDTNASIGSTETAKKIVVDSD